MKAAVVVIARAVGMVGGAAYVEAATVAATMGAAGVVAASGTIGGTRVVGITTEA